MRRGFFFVLMGMIVFCLTSCGGKGCDLLILNWGDYMAEELIEEFESTYKVDVKVVTTDSNEQMYSNVINRTADYDIVIPSDYMVHQLKSENLLNALDYSKLENYSEDMFVPSLTELMNGEDCMEYKGYYVPYFWGSLGIMYNKRKEGIEEAVYQYGWKVLFEPEILPKGSRIGMYGSSRDALAAAELYLGYSLNTTDKEEIDSAMKVLKEMDFYQWGTDDLKIDVSQGKVDVALVYSGDYFDSYYADLEAEEGLETEVSNTDNYSIYSPVEHNNVFFDAMVIPKTSTNVDLAYRFIDFMLEYDHSYTNADYIGYCPTIDSVYEGIIHSEDWSDILEIEAYDPTKILNTEGSWVEVYRYLGEEVYAYIERKFTEVIFK